MAYLFGRPSLQTQIPDDVYEPHLFVLQVRLAPEFAKPAASESTATQINM